MRQNNFQRIGSTCRTAVACLALTTLSVSVCSANRAGQEITYPPKEFSKLDTFEGLNLEDADKLYKKRDYKGAYAAYKAYSFEFVKSKALPYVLLRMGRCLHMIDKRHAAIKAYQDVVDYFPDDVSYAAGALFYMGQCHQQNGDTAKQNAVWAKMVKDDDYVAQPNSGTALTYLGGAMQKLGKFEEAAEYHWRTAVAFSKTNHQAAAAARNAVLAHYVTRSQNNDKLQKFYVEAGGFDGRGQKTDKPNEDNRYWSTVLNTSLRMPAGAELEKKEKAARYWSAKMGDRFTDNDDLRKQWIDLQNVYEKDSKSWLAGMEKQYKLQPATLARVLKWSGYYGVDPKMRSNFFASQSKAFLGGLKNPEKMALMNQLRSLRMNEESRTVMRSVSIQGMNDEEILKLTNFAALYEPEDFVLRYFAKMKDKTFAAKSRFDYYNARTHRNRPFMEKALQEMPILQKSPKYAGQALGMSQAVLLQGLGRYDEAIKAYRVANKQPQSTWGVTDCMVALKQYSEAVKTVQGLESVGGSTASSASLKIADIYRISGNKGKEVQQLRMVLRRYPKSGESSEAHNRLERYGVALTGGEAEAEE
ncbi:tetratricopeptide repeat protein [Rubritalea profundi]|uniref:tetratricopeptide repeat protein n=1 Tax=Rubritalea profundi TaxID=1658618 RepID=UPI0013FD4EAA|nr:tetratricopeptide repeat protein [Rubritalea profundi]